MTLFIIITASILRVLPMVAFLALVWHISRTPTQTGLAAERQASASGADLRSWRVSEEDRGAGPATRRWPSEVTNRRRAPVRTGAGLFSKAYGAMRHPGTHHRGRR